MSAADWSTLVFTLPRRKMAWVHPVVSFPLKKMVLRRIPIYFLSTIFHDLKPKLASERGGVVVVPQNMGSQAAKTAQKV